MPLRIVFLCSGDGGNLRFITKAIQLGWLENATIVGVIADRQCLATRFASESGIWTAQFDFSEDGQIGLMNSLELLAPDIIVTTVNKILGPAILKKFCGSLLNLHYSLLPSFGQSSNTKPVKLALNSGTQFVGVTVHHVEAEVDAGRQILQAAIPVEQNDVLDCLMEIVFRCGCISLLTGIDLFRADLQRLRSETVSVLELSGRPVLFNPKVAQFQDFFEESFWQGIKVHITGTLSKTS